MHTMGIDMKKGLSAIQDDMAKLATKEDLVDAIAKKGSGINVDGHSENHISIPLNINMQAPAAASTGASGTKDDDIVQWDKQCSSNRVPFAEFQEFFEIAVLDAEDLPSEMKLALLKVVNKNKDGYVTKTEWMKMKIKAKKDFGNDTKIAIKGYLRHIG